jgi:hypothetical protein
MSVRYQEGGSPEEISRSASLPLKPVELPVKPAAPGAVAPRIVDPTWFQFAGRQGFEVHLDLTGIVNAYSRVFVSISEIGIFDGQWKPFMGLASAEVHNVVPHDNGIVIVRGYIGWDSDINVRLSVFVA